MVNGAKTTVYPSRYFNTDGSTSSPSATKYIFDGDTLLATITGSNASSTIQYIHTDHLSGSSVITSATGTVIELLDYYPYGEIRLDEKTAGFNEQRKFTGSEYDDATGLNYMNARYYSGRTARFLSRDPVFLAIGDERRIRQTVKQELQELLSDPQLLNSHSFARDNPLALVDESGEFPSPKTVWNWTTATALLGREYVKHEARQQWQDYQEFRQASRQWQAEHPRETELIVNIIGSLGGEAISKIGQKGLRAPNPQSGINANVGEIGKNYLSGNVKSSFEYYEKIGFSKPIPGGKGGGIWKNDKGQLPSQPEGYYREFDVNPKTRPSRDAERFVTGKGGEVYYTNNHYGQAQDDQPAFWRLK